MSKGGCRQRSCEYGAGGREEGRKGGREGVCMCERQRKMYSCVCVCVCVCELGGGRLNERRKE
jgi:hypothetical protein